MSNRKAVSIGVACVALVSAMIWASKPLNRAKVYAAFGHRESQCVAIYAGGFIDPDSMSVVGSRAAGTILVVTTRAKNGFGGFSIGHLYCVLDAHGDFDEISTRANPVWD